MKKKVLSIAMIGAVCMTCASGAFAASTVVENQTPVSQTEQTQPPKLSIDNGSMTGTQYHNTYSLTSKNGKTVNFWIQNNGTNPVKISINGKQEREIQPGAQGHISESVGYVTSDYVFKAVPGKNGGDIHIDFKIAQRD